MAVTTERKRFTASASSCVVLVTADTVVASVSACVGLRRRRARSGTSVESVSVRLRLPDMVVVLLLADVRGDTSAELRADSAGDCSRLGIRSNGTSPNTASVVPRLPLPSPSPTPRALPDSAMRASSSCRIFSTCTGSVKSISPLTRRARRDRGARKDECQWFLTALEVRPRRILVKPAHEFPCCCCHLTRVISSSTVHPDRTIDGSRQFTQCSRACLPFRWSRYRASVVHRAGPWRATQSRIMASSSSVQIRRGFRQRPGRDTLSFAPTLSPCGTP
mmetsp:Transcript_2121/g.6718  ORF Transcript_2121/g.6718 Transcript_2121/m.6718 type:complete len:277 (-) Transcript_2121:280-1110(-)